MPRPISYFTNNKDLTDNNSNMMEPSSSSVGIANSFRVNNDSLVPTAEDLSCSFSANPNSLEGSMYGSYDPQHYPQKQHAKRHNNTIPYTNNNNNVLPPHSPSQEHVPKRQRYAGVEGPLNAVETLFSNIFSCGCSGMAMDTQKDTYTSKPFARPGNDTNGPAAKAKNGLPSHASKMHQPTIPESATPDWMVANGSKTGSISHRPFQTNRQEETNAGDKTMNSTIPRHHQGWPGRNSYASSMNAERVQSCDTQQKQQQYKHHGMHHEPERSCSGMVGQAQHSLFRFSSQSVATPSTGSHSYHYHSHHQQAGTTMGPPPTHPPPPPPQTMKMLLPPEIRRLTLEDVGDLDVTFMVH
jgi:hypothetical protein